ncbi:MAG TPA: carboxylating nicotinate-nucleotide diphosphorylase [Gemmatimonadales bacterium]|nr:carboxylating nicotinate-nucleotide diphosphorylase [Gemmatimonadales bacterium]
MTTPEYPGKGGNGEQRRTHRQDAGARAPRTVTPGEMPAINASAVWFPLSRGELEAVVRDALDEDGALNDLTTLATVHADRKARATLVAREQGVIAGVPLAVEAFRQLDPRSSIRIDAEDGTRVSPGQSVLFLSGHARSMLSAERVALNFLQRLSGIATGTHQFVQAVKGTRAQILDTRKTTPGWRRLEKYAVRCGGGVNHRFDLASAILIKDNHLAALDGDVEAAVRGARALAPAGVQVEVECDRLDQVERALAAGADIILLDNMSTVELRQCVNMVNDRVPLEASGGVNLDTVRAIAETGVGRVSVGALTHSVRAMDLALEFA